MIRIAEGNTAVLYRIDASVQKHYKPGIQADAVLREASNQRTAARAGLPVPRVTNVCLELPMLEMDYVAGQSLGDIAMKQPNDLPSLFHRAIDVQQTIHHVDATGLTSMSSRLAYELETNRYLSTSEKCLLMEQLSSFTYVPRLCHGDFHLFNLIQTEQGDLMILDWADASSGDPLADVCRSYLLYHLFDSSVAAVYLDRFCATAHVTRASILKWLPLLAACRMNETNDETELAILQSLLRAR